MSKKKILLTKNLIINVKKELRDFSVHIWDEEQEGKLTNQKLREVLPHYDGIISMLSDKLNIETLETAKNLKIIAQYAVGYNNIDMEYCKKQSITVTNTPDVLSHATAELGLALLMNLSRNISSSSQSAIKGQWQGWEPCGHIGRSLKSLKLGIIGPGRIGTEFTKLCKNAFNHEVFYNSRTKNTNFEKLFNAKYMELDSLLTHCDVISIHCPLNKDTTGLLNLKNMSLLKSDAFLINTARGEIINQFDLIQLAEQRKDLKFGLDVTDPEPLSPQNPLYSLDNVLITPHIGSATRETREEMGNIVCNNIKKYFLGQELKYNISY